MKEQFLKVAAVSPELRVADPAFNAQKIVEHIEAQYQKGTELLVFPELSISGYTCGDLFLQQALLDGCLIALKQIATATERKKMLVFVGLPLLHQGKLYNCAAAVSDGRILGIIPKTYLPNYGEFYEARYFTSAPAESCWHPLDTFDDDYGAYFSAELIFRDENYPDIAVGCEICEDLWAPASPSVRLAAKGATVIVNLSASNETIGKHEYRKTLLSAQSGKNLCAYVYCSAGMGESTADTIFSGNNFVYENGTLLAEALPFSGEAAEAEVDVGFLLAERRKVTTFCSDARCDFMEAAFVTEGDLTLRRVDPMPFVPADAGERCARAELILSIQAQALARRVSQIHADSLVIGVSGGLDSTLALLVCCRAFDLLQKDRSGILAYTMPGFGTTKKTKRSADSLMETLGVTAKTVPISRTVLSHFKDIEHDPAVCDTTYENAQARYRTMILMDVANKHNGLVVGTGDLSELALGWCTYNGDHMSMYAVNASVPKTLVRYLVAAEALRLGGRAKKVLDDILGTEISPELLPPDAAGNIAQKTEDLVGPYELNDFYLHCFLRRGDRPSKTLYLAERAFAGKYDRETLKKWLVRFYRRFFNAQFKRDCVPNGVKIGSVSLSPRADWRMPSDASAALYISEAEQL